MHRRRVAGGLAVLLMGTLVPAVGPADAVRLTCAVFPRSSIWNTRVDRLPVHARSGEYVSAIGSSSHVHADFGSGTWDGGPIGIPYVVVAGSQRTVRVNFDEADESDRVRYPVPRNAPVEGGPDSDGDRHVIVLDTGHCRLYELFSAYRNADGSWDAYSGAVFNLRSHQLRPETWTSADAAGLPIFPGLVRYDEVLRGEIRHAIRFTAPVTQRAYVWPARHWASSRRELNLPPMGTRFRLKASFDISRYPKQLRVILTAMKRYGVILADNGSPWYISGSPDRRWDNDVLHQLHQIPGSAFEAVDTSGLMISSNSAQSRPG